jgi:hypothetical protein
MKRSQFLIIAALVYAVFGLAVLFVPVEFMRYFGVNLAGAAVPLARVLGASLVGAAVIVGLSRDDALKGTLKNVLAGNAIFNAIALIIGVYAIQNGLVNSYGWGHVLIHALLAAGFGYFWNQKR